MESTTRVLPSFPPQPHHQVPVMVMVLVLQAMKFFQGLWRLRKEARLNPGSGATRSGPSWIPNGRNGLPSGYLTWPWKMTHL